MILSGRSPISAVSKLISCVSRISPESSSALSSTYSSSGYSSCSGAASSISSSDSAYSCSYSSSEYSCPASSSCTNDCSSYDSFTDSSMDSSASDNSTDSVSFSSFIHAWDSVISSWSSASTISGVSSISVSSSTSPSSSFSNSPNIPFLTELSKFSNILPVCCNTSLRTSSLCLAAFSCFILSHSPSTSSRFICPVIGWNTSSCVSCSSSWTASATSSSGTGIEAISSCKVGCSSNTFSPFSSRRSCSSCTDSSVISRSMSISVSCLITRASSPGTNTLLIAPVWGSGAISDTPVTICATWLVCTGTGCSFSVVSGSDCGSSSWSSCINVLSSVLSSADGLLVSVSVAFFWWMSSGCTISALSSAKISSSSAKSSFILSATTFCRLIVLYWLISIEPVSR